MPPAPVVMLRCAVVASSTAALKSARNWSRRPPRPPRARRRLAPPRWRRTRWAPRPRSTTRWSARRWRFRCRRHRRRSARRAARGRGQRQGAAEGEAAHGVAPGETGGGVLHDTGGPNAGAGERVSPGAATRPGAPSRAPRWRSRPATSCSPRPSGRKTSGGITRHIEGRAQQGPRRGRAAVRSRRAGRRAAGSPACRTTRRAAR